MANWDDFESVSSGSNVQWSDFEPEPSSPYLSTDYQPQLSPDWEAARQRAEQTPAIAQTRQRLSNEGLIQTGPDTFERIGAGPSDMEIAPAGFRSRIAMSAPARALGIGGAAERELRREEGFSPSPTVSEMPGMAFQLMTPPPPVQEAAKKVTDPLANLLPDEAAGIAQGARDVALQFPWAAGAAGALTQSPKLGAALLGAFTGEFVWDLPEQKAAFDAAMRAGNKREAYRIATTAALSGLLLGAGAKHSVGRLREGTAPMLRPFGDRDFLAPQEPNVTPPTPGAMRPQEIEAIGVPLPDKPRMLEPDVLEEMRAKQELETRGKVSYGAAAPTLLRTAIRSAEDVGLTKSAAAAATTAVGKGPDAGTITETTAIHGNLRASTGEGAGALPVAQGGAGVQPQAGGGIPGGEAKPPNVQTSQVPLKQYLADVAAGKVKTTQGATAFGRTIKTAEEIAELKRAYEETNAQARRALDELPENATPEQMRAAINEASKPQFIAEAIEAATGADLVKGKDGDKFKALMDAGQPRPLDAPPSSGQPAEVKPENPAQMKLPIAQQPPAAKPAAAEPMTRAAAEALIQARHPGKSVIYIAPEKGGGHIIQAAKQIGVGRNARFEQAKTYLVDATGQITEAAESTTAQGTTFAPKSAAVPAASKARLEGEARARVEGEWAALMKENAADAKKRVAAMTDEQAQATLDRLNAAPGDNPIVRQALVDKLGLSPLIREWSAIKAQNKGRLLAFRLGDFYEFFQEDAPIAGEALNIRVSDRNPGTRNAIKMTGIPAHAAEKYFRQLNEAGHAVAVVEQTEPSTPGRPGKRMITDIWDAPQREIHEQAELNELRMIKEGRGGKLGRLSERRLGELEEKEKAGTLRPPAETKAPPGETKPAESGTEPSKEEHIGMGGATPGSFNSPDNPTAIAAVSEYLAGNPNLSPNAPLSERFSRWLGLAGQWSKAKDTFTQALAGVRAASAAALDSYLHLPKWDGFEAARGAWSGADNRSGLEVRNFIKAINKAIPDPTRQEAITNWIQAGGDPNLLRARASASTDPALRRGYEAALNLSSDELVVAQNIQGYLEARLNEGIDAGILRQGVDNYVTQIWKRENPATTKLRADLFGDGSLNPNFKFAKQRVFDSYFEGEQAGFQPKDKRIGTLVGAYELAFNRAISSRGFIKALHEAKAADGMPLAMVSGKTIPVGAPGATPDAFLIKPHQAPKGAVTADGRPYRVVDHWALRDWKWSATGPDGQPVIMQGDMLVHPDYYRDIKNMLSRSALTRPEGIASVTTRPLLQASAFLKQTKLSLSAFHLTQEGIHGLFHRVNPGNLVKLDLATPEQRGLANHGLQIADSRAAELFGEGLAGGGLVGKIPALGNLQVHFNDWLFKDYIPRLKMTMALDALERNRKAYAKDLASGKVTDDQLQALTAREANAAFGELNYRMMGRNPTVQDFLRLTVLAPDFLEARAKFVAQALKPYGREQQVALGLMGATLFITARILNKALDDDPHWDHPFSVIHKGKEYRLRTVLGDVQHLIQDPRMFAYNRLSPAGRTTIETLTTRDARGIKRTGWEQMKDAAEWMLPIPTQTKSDTTASQQVLSSMGVGVRNYGPVQQVYELADAWKKDNPNPRIKEQYETYQRETHPDSPYKPLRDAIIKGDDKAAREAITKLRETRTPAQIREGLEPRPFTGSAANERKFLQTLDEHQRQVYRQAEEERKRIKREAIRLLH